VVEVVDRREVIDSVRALTNKGKPIEAINLLDRALKEDPENFTLESWRAWLASDTVPYPQSIQAMVEFLNRFPKKGYPHILMARIVSGKGNHRLALRYVIEAERIGDSDPDVVKSLKGRFLLKLGRRHEASAAVGDTAGPNCESFRFELNPPTSEEQLEASAGRLLRCGVDGDSVAFQVASWHWRQGQKDKSIQALKEALVEHPHSEQLVRLLRTYLDQLKRPKEALAAVKKFLKQNPDSINLATWYAKRLRSRRRYFSFLIVLFRIGRKACNFRWGIGRL
jgi:tetratricopeptide (TPR) repeat protein